MGIEELVRQSERLAEAMDPIVESIRPIELQAVADSAWYRLCSINMMVRDEAGGAIAASLARSLLEQASYWDWASAKGIGASHIPMWAGLEYTRLENVAHEMDDDTWLGWVLPPGSTITTRSGEAIQRSSRPRPHRQTARGRPDLECTP